MKLEPASRNTAAAAAILNGIASAVKTRLCNKFSSAAGCKYGDNCHFAHGDRELDKPTAPSPDKPRAMAPISGRMGSRMEPPPPSGPAASFGDSATAKISIDASLAGAIIGYGCVHYKQICHRTGSKLSIREHESDPTLRNIELGGSFVQSKQASAMIKRANQQPSSGPKSCKNFWCGWWSRPQGQPGSNHMTKLCDNFAKGKFHFWRKSVCT